MCCTLLPAARPRAQYVALSTHVRHAATWSPPLTCSSASRFTRLIRISSSLAKVSHHPVNRLRVLARL